MRLTHFGGGGRAPDRQVMPPAALLESMRGNSFLKDHLASVVEHFATQGDGNHFFYVGRLSSTGKVALVTHHGSRKPGAMLYKAGMTLAERHRRKMCIRDRSRAEMEVMDRLRVVGRAVRD